VSKNGNGYNGRYTAQQFIDVIPGTGGIITTIAKRVGCKWHTAKKYVTEYATVKAAYDAECESVLDAAESVILGDIMDKEVQTAKWYLTMKGADRGYAPKQRTEHEGSLSIVPVKEIIVKLQSDEPVED
jgi:hypothetical protein